MNLALDFGETSDEALAPAAAGPAAALQQTSAIQKLAARFEEAMQEPGSPVRAIHHQPAKPAVLAPFPEALNPLLRQALAERGIESLYSHQAAAVESSLAGKNTVVVTPDCQRQNALLQLASGSQHPGKSGNPRIVSVSDESAG